jgi:hypothetical protein
LSEINMPSNANSQRRATTIFAALALLVLPLCTRICGSPDCAIAPVIHAEDCHGSPAAIDDASQTSIASIHTCGLRQLRPPTLDKK